ncbi:hypothetical protein K3495_g146 [Podosphaera aphanis]|nr:hypothetical protein K3495_g146 [Podosphaera aphanis]
MRIVHVIGVRVVLLDIEGTLCRISFVKDVLYPFALDALSLNIDRLWTAPDFQPYLTAFAPACRTEPITFVAHIRALMAADDKSAPLKALQGFLWKSGYESGALRCPLFPDVHRALTQWHAARVPVLIYSSGSVEAQKLLFQYTDAGDLRPLLSGYFDTTTAGPKTDGASYARIVAESGVNVTDPRHWVFCSDYMSEIKAAQSIGMKGVFVTRPGNTSTISDEERLVQNVAELLTQLNLQKPALNGTSDSTVPISHLEAET